MLTRLRRSAALGLAAAAALVPLAMVMVDGAKRWAA
jgi:hypothetical protein